MSLAPPCAPTRLARRATAPDAYAGLPAHLPDVLRRVYSQRGLSCAEDLNLELAGLPAPARLKGMDAAVVHLATALAARKKIVVAGDYDADGATSTALAVSGLRAMGGTVDFVVPDRVTMGYGLSPLLVEAARAKGAEVILTVDNGINALAGVAHAQATGLPVIVTDHHLPGDTLPNAEALVNPNQPGCTFPSKNLAGVGVMYYTLIALRAHLRTLGWFKDGKGPNLADSLDLVALGTVADVVKLDPVNRILVARGLARMNRGRLRPGLKALIELARPGHALVASDLGFFIGPRLNAVGRLDDMSHGIACLLAESDAEALPLAQMLDDMNRQRRRLQTESTDEALLQADPAAAGMVVYNPDWHEGVVGLIAGKVKEHFHRPTVALTRAHEDGLLKGSARAIPGFHFRDALVELDRRHPGILHRYGGHAMAAGMTLHAHRLEEFILAFDALAQSWLPPAALDRILETDGELAPHELDLSTAHLLERAGPWGQGFPEPVFEGAFLVQDVKLMGADQQHVRYRLAHPGGASAAPLEAVHFNGARQAASGGRLHLAYRLCVNRFNRAEAAQLMVDHLEKL